MDRKFIDEIDSFIRIGDIRSLRSKLNYLTALGFDLDDLENRPDSVKVSGRKDTWLIHTLNYAAKTKKPKILLIFINVCNLDIMGIGAEGKSFFVKYLENGNLSTDFFKKILAQITTLIPYANFEFMKKNALYFDGRRLEIYNMILEHNSKFVVYPFVKREEPLVRGKPIEPMPKPCKKDLPAAAPQISDYNYAIGNQEQQPPTFMLPTYPSQQSMYRQQQISSSSSSAAQFSHENISLSNDTSDDLSLLLSLSHTNSGRTSRLGLDKTSESSSSASVDNTQRMEQYKQAREFIKRIVATAKKSQVSDEECYALHISEVPRLAQNKVGPRLLWQFDPKDRDPCIKLRASICATEKPLEGMRGFVEIYLSNMMNSLPEAIFGMMKQCLSENIEEVGAVDATQLIMQAYKIIEVQQFCTKNQDRSERVSALVENLLNFTADPMVAALYQSEGEKLILTQLKVLIADLLQKSKPEVRPSKMLKRTDSSDADAAGSVEPGHGFISFQSYAELADKPGVVIASGSNPTITSARSIGVNHNSFSDKAEEVFKNAIDPKDLPKCQYKKA